MFRSTFHAALLLLSAAVGHGFVVPTSLPDGLYKVSFDDAGNVVGDFTLLPVPDTLSGNSLHRRQGGPPPLPNPQPKCGSGTLDLVDFRQATSLFNTMCDTNTRNEMNTAIVYTSGSAMAYMCNYLAYNRCWRQEYDEANGILDRSCGAGRIGSVFVAQWRKAYGRDVTGAAIC